MLNRLITVVILVPAAIVLIALSVANRGPVAFSIDPFSADNPAMTMSLPLFVLLFAALILGLLIGGIATWLGQHKYRKAAKRTQSEANMLRSKAEAAKPAATAAGDGLPALRN